MFLVEQAHWFYEVREHSYLPHSCMYCTAQKKADCVMAFQDFCRDRDPGLPSMSLKAFAGIIFRHCPGLAHLLNDKQAIFAQFSAYKQAVPVMGAILLNASMDKCLLVRGYKEGSSWGFPRGKLAKDETDAECAVREVNIPSWPAWGKFYYIWRAAFMALLHDLHSSSAWKLLTGTAPVWKFSDLSIAVRAMYRGDLPVMYMRLW